MNLVKGIAAVVGLGGIVTAIGIGVSSSSSQTPKAPKLKKITVGERLSEALYSFIGFEELWNLNWQSNFHKYQLERDESQKFRESDIKDWQGLKNKCKEGYNLEIDGNENDVRLFKKWCTAGGNEGS